MFNRRRAVAALALLAAGSVALSGCAGGGGAPAPDPDSTSASIEAGELLINTPDATGELESATWNLVQGEPSSLDPIKAFNYPENTVVANICEPLLQVQPDFTIAPNLASSFESPDASTYIYNIRDDVQFWDGSPMTMEDVIWSLERHNDPAEGSYWNGSVTTNVASIEQTGDWQVTIKLTEPDTTFNNYMITPIGVVVSKSHREAAGESYGTPSGGVMCTGPFSLKTWDQGQQIVLERNDNYWNADLMPKTKELSFRFIVDQAAIGTALQTGEIDGTYDVPLGAVPTLQNSTTGSLYYGRSTQLVAVISSGKGAFADPAVRQALMLATDREAIAQTVFEGTASASRSLVPNNAWSYGDEIFTAARDSLPASSVDLEAAKAALAEATVDITQPIRIAYPAERTFYADIISEVGNAATSLGMTVELVAVPSAQYGAVFSDQTARDQYDGFITYNYMDVPDPLAHLRTLIVTDGGSNYDNYSDPATDQMIFNALKESDPDKRAELTVEIEQKAMELMPWIPIVEPATRLYLNERVTGVPASFTYLYFPWAAKLGAA